MTILNVTLEFTGGAADDHQLDLYDVAQALVGFERSLALTTHLVLNNEIITQAPALKGARIFSRPPRAGSWELTAGIFALSTAGAVLYKVGTAPKDTPLGHLIRSAYDYVVSTTLGFHVDFEKTLGQQIEDAKRVHEQASKLDQNRFDSLIEKCEPAIREMHRPISKSETATKGRLITSLGRETAPLRHPLTLRTYEHIAHTEQSSAPVDVTGRVSSYNINTFKGRIYVREHNRPVPFELSEKTRGRRTVGIVTRSLTQNAQDRRNTDVGYVLFRAFENRSRAGHLKNYYVVGVESEVLED